MITAHLFISGFVQGVGYRHFVKSRAEQLSLTGFVRNLPDGRVEVMAAGEKESLEKLIIDCKKGPFLSQVEEVVVKWEKINTLYKSFEIIF